MQAVDFDQHNAEVEALWAKYRAGTPERVPLIFGINPRLTLDIPEANPNGMSFRDYLGDPDRMLQRQLLHQEWVRLNIPQDQEMGYPKHGWPIYVDFQNVYEAAWLGCPVHFRDNQVPDTSPLLAEDSKKHLLFDRGSPDPFQGGLMAENWAYYEHFCNVRDHGVAYKRVHIGEVTPSGLGTDGPVTIACNIRGATQFLTDLLCDPDYAVQLLDFITEATITRIRAYRSHLGLPLKTEGWQFADDSIQLISTEMYEQIVFPFHKRLVDTFSDGGSNGIHLCGDATRHFPFLKDNLNIQSFDTGFPVDFTWLRETLGPGVEIQGGPSAPFLRQATPREVSDEVRRILSSGIMEGGRFILREGNNLAPGTPLENLWAMYDTVRDYGTYAN